mgnify:CR=1 FL=1
MRKIILLTGILFSSTILVGCNSANTSQSKSETESSSTAKTKYKYYANNKSFHSNKGSLTINKLIGYKKDGNNYFILDVTFKNTSKKQQDAANIMSPNIVAYQLNKNRSQKVNLSGSNSASDYYSSDDVDNYNRFNEITDSHSNKILPGKAMRTLMEFSYKLNNNKNNIVFSLNDPDATSKETVNPNKNKITFSASAVQYNSLNLSDYSN